MTKPNKALRKAAREYKKRKQYEEVLGNGLYGENWEQKRLLSELAIKLKNEQMSKQKFKTELRKSIFSGIGEYCCLSKEHDYIEITEWTNGEGFDIDIQHEGKQKMSITWGQFKLLKKLVKQLEKVNDLETDSSKNTFGL
jgi:hypothetical protein